MQINVIYALPTEQFIEKVDAPDGATAEDDGYLLTYVYDPADNLSELIIMEASNMEQEPVARIHLPTRVPAGFHGSWIADPD